MTKGNTLVLAGTVAAISVWLFRLLNGSLEHVSFSQQQIYAVIAGISIAKFAETLVKKSVQEKGK